MSDKLKVLPSPKSKASIKKVLASVRNKHEPIPVSYSAKKKASNRNGFTK